MDYLVFYNRFEWLLSFIISICIALYLFLEEESLKQPIKCGQGSPENVVTYPTLESSISCHGERPETRICRFKNLYYNSESERFIFVHGPESKYYGMPKKRYDSYFLDSSSVAEHNLLHFVYDDVSLHKFTIPNEIRLIKGTSHIFHRFNPENTMHILHDDLLPLFHTINTYAKNDLIYDDVRVLFLDNRDPGDFIDLYKLVSSNLSFVKNLDKGLTRFEDAVVGLTKDTLWYQYGFGRPQGVISNINTKQWHIESFKKHCFKTLSIQQLGYEKNHIVLFSRRKNRKIINELEVVLALAKHFQQEVIVIDSNTMHPFDVIKTIATASVLVGMHGAELAYTLFLPNNATIIELFPFALRAQFYKPYSTLCKILCFHYFSWENTISENTVTHPEYLSEYGGFDEFSNDTKEAILNSIPVEPKPCCYDPAWLHRIYQDTFVDTESLFQSIDTQLLTSNICDLENNEIYPSIIKNISCVLKAMINDNNDIVSIEWKQPYNLNYVDSYLVLYDVWLQQWEDTVVYRTDMTSLSVNKSLSKYPVHVWVRCKYNENIGPLSEPCECKRVE